MPTHARPEAHPDPLAFNPPREKIPQILDHLDTPFASLAMVAHANGTTVEALSLWLLTPEIKARNKLIDTAAAQRTHSLALRNARRALAVASQILERATEEDVGPAYSNHPKAILARNKSRDVANDQSPAPRPQRRAYRMVRPPLSAAPQPPQPVRAQAVRPSETEPPPHNNRLAPLIADAHDAQPRTSLHAIIPRRPAADLIARAGAPPS